MFSLSSRVLQPTCHLLGTPPTLSPLFEPLLFALVPLRNLSTTPTLNNHKRSGACPTLLVFVGKTHRVMRRLVHLVVDLAALRLLVYPRSSEVGFGAIRQCSQNQPT